MVTSPEEASSSDGVALAGQALDTLEDDIAKKLEADWERAAARLRQRKPHSSGEGRGEDDRSDESDESDDDFDAPAPSLRLPREVPDRGPSRCMTLGITLLLTVLMVGGLLFWRYTHPEAVRCSLEVVRPKKFKIDVTDFFAPRVSAAAQLVVRLTNANMFRSMLLEACKLTVYEEETGLKLGTATQNSLVLAPFSSTQVTLSLNALAGSASQAEQRRLAALFLAKKALMLTLVATASSRLPLKGSRSVEVSSNSSRKLDLSTLTKEPFFQRAPPPPPPPDEGAKKSEKHDVPI